MNREYTRQNDPFLLPGVIAILALIVAGLTACSTYEDPRKGGFISGVSGLATGTYERRLLEKEDRLAAECAEQLRLQRERDLINAEQEQISGERRNAERRLAALNASLRKMEQRVGNAERKTSLDQEEAKRLKAEIEALDQARSLIASNPGLDTEGRKARITELEQRKQRLEKALLAVLEK